MCRTDDVVALDFPGVCWAALFLWKSALGETHLASRGVDHVSGGVVGLSLDANKHAHILASAVYFIGKKPKSSL